jgi:hypothetical protein
MWNKNVKCKGEIIILSRHFCTFTLFEIEFCVHPDNLTVDNVKHNIISRCVSWNVDFQVINFNEETHKLDLNLRCCALDCWDMQRATDVLLGLLLLLVSVQELVLFYCFYTAYTNACCKHRCSVTSEIELGYISKASRKSRAVLISMVSKIYINVRSMRSIHVRFGLTVEFDSSVFAFYSFAIFFSMNKTFWQW